MKHATKKIIEIQNEDTTIQIEIEGASIDFYKKETGRTRVTAKGLSDFFNSLVRFFNNRD